LLCSTHHNVIDTVTPDKYPIDTLDKWKQDREGKSFEVLKDVPSPDEGRLQSLINESLREQNKILAHQITRFEEALAKLAAIDSDAAGILKQRMSTANKELEAARLLMHTQDSSVWMREAGQLLAHTQDTALFLLQAAQDLRGLEDRANSLLAAARQQENAADVLAALDSQLARRINDLRNMER
jgi:dihydropteroate synthase